MKKISMILTVLLLSSCEMANLKYGYYWNPVKVLSMAEEGIRENDVNELSDVLSDSALCNYGSEEGIINLTNALKNIDSSSFNEPIKISGRHLSQAKWNGYYVYYQERYVASAKDLNGRPLLKINILCEFGDSKNSARLLNAPVSSYSAVSCSIDKIKNYAEELSNPVCK